MAQITVEELYNGEGTGKKYGGILNAVMAEVMTYGIPKDQDEQTWLELLLVKHALIVAEKMKSEGDFVSELSDAEPPSCHGEVQDGNP